ncbi:MAG: hypothetical protein IRZ08_20280 [Frankia sp.]|nr:hypothetical protein [Frankia sp.]
MPVGVAAGFLLTAMMVVLAGVLFVRADPRVDPTAATSASAAPAATTSTAPPDASASATSPTTAGLPVNRVQPPSSVTPLPSPAAPPVVSSARGAPAGAASSPASNPWWPGPVEIELPDLRDVFGAGAG